MTREEAISLLTQVNKILVNSNSWLENTHEPLNIAFDMAIKALEQEPCEDCVSRKRLMDNYNGVETPVGYRKVVDLEVIKNMPSVTPTRKKGKWIEERDDYGEITHWHCSNCYDDSGFTTTCKWDFCPNCGAEMESEE